MTAPMTMMIPKLTIRSILLVLSKPAEKIPWMMK